MTEHPLGEHSDAITAETLVRELELLLKFRLQLIESRKPWFVNAVAGVGLVAILGFAAFLGSLNFQVNAVSTKIDQVQSTVSEGNGSLKERTSVIETKLTEIDKKLDKITPRSK